MMTGPIYLSAPDVGELEEEYLIRALRSGWVAPTGPEVDAFEREVARRVGTGHAVAVSSGSAALHLALLSLGIGPGQVVVVPTLTFAASANAVVYTGADPVFVDCDGEYANVDPDLLTKTLSILDTEGVRVGAVITVDMFGNCADYGQILPACERYEIPVVEDAAEAFGATSGGRAAGSFGRAGVLSFNGNKIVTTSGGGMLVSDDTDLAAHCRYLSTQAREPVTHYEHRQIGYSYGLSNLLAAVGRAQLARLDTMMARRRSLRQRYRDLFGAVAGVRLLGGDGAASNCWLTTAVVDPDVAGWRAGDLAAHLARARIETRPVWKPMHLQPVFATRRAVLTGVANQLFDNGITLPSGSGLDDSSVARVLDCIHEFIGTHR